MKVQIPDASTCVPYNPYDILALLGSAPFPWWIAGGWSLDLFLGKQTRDHFDIDVAISRNDQLLAQLYLNHWDFCLPDEMKMAISFFMPGNQARLSVTNSQVFGRVKHIILPGASSSYSMKFEDKPGFFDTRMLYNTR